jgi:2-hydroxy-4-carboxymuconate semialdehyde hemiacetal dehydrogenase
MVGYGMMGAWHSQALEAVDCCLHTLVGRRPEAAREFAARFGYRKWTTSLDEALADGAVDAVILANPSEQHEEFALKCLRAGKPTLVEIPLAMSLAGAETVVAEAARRGLALGVVHPLRVRAEMAALRRRLAAGQESIRFVDGRFYVHRLENVGASGYRRSWTDNLLWHHLNHLLDLGLWLLAEPPRAVHSFMPPPDPRTGTPMDAFVAVETARDQSLVVTGSYYGRERLFEALVVTDRDSYRLDVIRDQLTTGGQTVPILAEAANCGLVTIDFVEALRAGRPPVVPGADVLPALRVMQAAQEQWDEAHGGRPIPGRGLPEGEAQ